MRPPEVPPELRGALVVAVDDSPSAQEALEFACRLAVGLGQPLHALHIWNFVTGSTPGHPRDEPVSEAAWQEQAEQELRAITDASTTARPGCEVRRTVLHGNPVPTLLAVSEVAEHLVVGSRGRGGFAGLLLGSTSEQLVRHGRCPVTVVRRGASRQE